MAEEAPDNTNNTSLKAEELRLQGNALFSKKKWDLAIKLYQESTMIDGTSKNTGKLYLMTLSYYTCE